MNDKLPKGWVITKIETFIESMIGGASPKREDYTLDGILALNKGDIKKNGHLLIKENPKMLPLIYIENHENKIITNNNIVVTLRDLSQKADFLGLIAKYKHSEKAIITQGMYKLTISNECSGDYLIYFSNSPSYREIVKEIKVGVTQVHLRNNQFKNINIPLPPKNEQIRIANKLDSLLAKVQTTQNQLEKIPPLLKRFRESVLATAVTGNLINSINENSTEKWLEKKIGDIIKLNYGKSLPAKKRSGNQFAVYGSNGVIGHHKESIVSGPFIIVGRKGSFGEVTWSENDGWPIDTTYFVSLNDDRVELKYVFFLLQTIGLKTMNRSTAIPGLNREDVYSLKVKLPSYIEQLEIVRRVETLFSLADCFEKKYKKAKAQVDRLTQSILAKAFRGELVPQDPNDESAEKLLEKIKAEQLELKKVTKKTTKKKVTKKNTGKRMSKKTIKVLDALKQAGKPLSGQQLLAAAGYPNDSDTEKLEAFFLDIRHSLKIDKSIVLKERTEDGQDWFELKKSAKSK